MKRYFNFILILSAFFAVFLPKIVLADSISFASTTIATSIGTQFSVKVNADLTNSIGAYFYLLYDPNYLNFNSGQFNNGSIFDPVSMSGVSTSTQGSRVRLEVSAEPLSLLAAGTGEFVELFFSAKSEEGEADVVFESASNYDNDFGEISLATSTALSVLINDPAAPHLYFADPEIVTPLNATTTIRVSGENFISTSSSSFTLKYNSAKFQYLNATTSLGSSLGALTDFTVTETASSGYMYLNIDFTPATVPVMVNGDLFDINLLSSGVSSFSTIFLTDTATTTTVITDGTGPYVSINAPFDDDINSYVNASPLVTITGSSTDSSAVDLIYYKLNSEATKIATGTENWSVNLSLSAGNNTLAIISHDDLGNIATTTISIVYSTGIPTVTMSTTTVSVDSDMEFSFTVRADDVTNADNIELSLNYDATVLDFVSATNTTPSLMDPLFMFATATSTVDGQDLLNFTATINGAAKSGSGNFVVFTMRTKEIATSTVISLNSFKVYHPDLSYQSGSSTNQIAVDINDIVAPVRSAGSPSGAQAAGVTQVTMSLTTDENATCRYSASSGAVYGAMTVFATTGGASHSVTLSGLAVGSYSYYVKCSDGSGNTNDDDYMISFSIVAAIDATAPVRSAGSPSGTLAAATTQTDLSLTTNENATCRYSTNSGAAYDAMTAFTTTGVLSHSATLSGLSAGSYSYYVKCSDAVANVNTDNYTISFSIAAVVSGGGGGGGSTYVPPIVIPVPTLVVLGTSTVISLPTAGTSTIVQPALNITNPSLTENPKSFTDLVTDEAAYILGRTSNLPLSGREGVIHKDVFQNLRDGETVTAAQKAIMAHFIHSGTPLTKKNGSSERAGSVMSFKKAFGRLPTSVEDWKDVIKIANGRWTTQRSAKAEKSAEKYFTTVYGRKPNLKNNRDENAIMVIAYGLRPSKRNTNSEKAAIKAFKKYFKKSPKEAVDWDTMRAIAYAGVKR